MASPGRTNKASALRRPGGGGRRDPDETDPAASLLDVDPGDVVEEPTIGGGDRTQVYDAQAAAQPAPAAFKLVVLAGPKAGAEYPIEQPSVTVGRAAENPVSVPDVSVSRRHVRLTRQGDQGYVVEDLGSGNGTKVNDARIDGPTPVRHGDEIALGDTVMQLVEVGAPAVKKRAKAAMPSGPTASPEPPAKSQKPARPVVIASAGGLDPKRKRLYLVAGAILGVFVLLVVVAKLAHHGPSNGETAPAPQTSESQQAMDDAMQLAKENRWVEAEKRLSTVAGESDDQTVHDAYEKVKRQAGYQQQLQDAKTKLAALDFLGARQEAGAIPESAAVYDEAQRLASTISDAIGRALEDARAAKEAGDKAKALDLVAKVLAADPDNDDAADLQADFEKKPHRVVRHVKKVEKHEAAHAAATHQSPALAMYLAGDVGRALQAAESANDPIATLIRRFEMAARDGLNKAQANKAAEAVMSLSQAVKLDRQLAHGRTSKPGVEVAKALGQQEYLLGVDCKGDSQLPRQAAHFRDAVDADGATDLYQRALGKDYDKAHELYVQAYVMKATNPDDAKRLFKIVCDTLPKSDEKHDRACNYFQQLGGGN